MKGLRAGGTCLVLDCHYGETEGQRKQRGEDGDIVPRPLHHLHSHCLSLPDYYSQSSEIELGTESGKERRNDGWRERKKVRDLSRDFSVPPI